MSAKWNYPSTATITISNGVDDDGYLITEFNDETAVGEKGVSFKGFKTPEDDEDANASTSTLKAMATIYGVFGLEDGLNLNTATVSAKAEIDGDLD